MTVGPLALSPIDGDVASVMSGFSRNLVARISAPCRTATAPHPVSAAIASKFLYKMIRLGFSIHLTETIPSIRDGECPVLARDDFDPVGRAVVRGRRRGARTGRRRCDRRDRQRRRL